MRKGFPCVKIQRRPIWLPLVVVNRPRTSFTVVLASTNPSAVFDNGTLGLASPLPLIGFGGSLEAVPFKEEGDTNIWDVYPWKQRTGDLFFDQVAELEAIPPVFDNPESTDAFDPYHSLAQDGFLKESSPKDLPESLFGSIEELELSSSLASSPCLPSSPNSDSKDSSDDSGSDKDKETNKRDSPIGSKRKKIYKSTPPSTLRDSKVVDKRIRNNEASKKFRHLKKGRHKALFDELQDLENENYVLKVQVEQMLKEINQLKTVLPDNKAHVSLLE